MADRSRAERAKLFAPYAALKGYYELILEEEDTHEPRRELSEDDAAALSEQLARLEKGMHISVSWYNGKRYVTLRGTVTRYEPELHMLSLDDRRIGFRDIAAIAEYEPEESYNAFLR